MFVLFLFALLIYCFIVFDFSSEEQENRLKSLFIRKLNVPLIDFEETEENYVELFGEMEEVIKNSFLKMKKEMENIISYETNIIESEGNTQLLYQHYMEYIKSESKKNRNQERCVLLFERIIKLFFSDINIWSMYIEFLEKNFSDNPEFVFSVYKRAVRNVYWSGMIWGKYLLYMERNKKSEDEILLIFETSIQSGLSSAEDFQLVFHFLFDFYRRAEKSDGYYLFFYFY